MTQTDDVAARILAHAFAEWARVYGRRDDMPSPWHLKWARVALRREGKQPKAWLIRRRATRYRREARTP